MEMGIVTCSACSGTGQQPCSHCGTEGQVWHDGGLTISEGYYTCAYCDGVGYKTCIYCGGAGEKEI